MRISSLISAEKGISTLISGEKALTSEEKTASSLISEDFLVFALREVAKISEEKNPH